MHVRLGYSPALDTLRAIAVLGVLAYHHDAATVPGGWLGVSLFFTLSGFLIAGVLFHEHESTGRIDLRAFWIRRIRRLLPASLAAIGLALVVVSVSAAHRGSDVIVDVRAAILNVANWRFVVADAPYAGSEGAPSPVQHYWSLAIEEQFYLVLPLLVAVAFRRRLLAWVVTAVIVGSLLLQFSLRGDIDRVYFGTDTRAAELAVGVALALALPRLREVIEARPWIADAWGAVAVVATVGLFLGAELSTGLVGSGGLTAVTVVWVGLLVASVLGRTFPAVCARGPLPALGRISYGVYLYHWPVYLIATRDRTGLSGAALLSLRVAVTLALAAASAALIELPIRRGVVIRRRVLPVAFAAVAVVVVATVALPFGSRPHTTTLAAGIVAPPPVATTAPSHQDIAAPEPVPDAEDDEDAEAQRADVDGQQGNPDVAPTTAPSEPASAPSPPRVPRVLVVGDSTAGATGTALQEVAAADGVADVYVYNVPGCAALRYEVARVRPGYEFRTDCVDIFADTVELAADVDPDLIVVFLGSAQLMDARYPGLDGFRSIHDATVATRYRSALAKGLETLSVLGVPVLWADVPVADWDLDAFGELMGGPLPGSGEASTNDPARAERLNAIDADVIAAVPNAVVWPYAGALAGPDGIIDRGVRSDGLHLAPAAAEALSRSVLLGLLEDAYRTVINRADADLTAREPTTWSAAVEPR